MLSLSHRLWSYEIEAHRTRRASTVGQSLEVQLDKLNSHGGVKIFQEKLSGVTAQRPQLKVYLEDVRDGDQLVETRLDRLARSTLDLQKTVAQLKYDGLGFRTLNQPFDTTTIEGRLMFSMLAAVAEFENEPRKERQVEGVEKAKRRGVKFGRKEKLTPDQIAEMVQKREDGTLIRELMAEYDRSKASVYRLLSIHRELEGGEE